MNKKTWDETRKFVGFAVATMGTGVIAVILSAVFSALHMLNAGTVLFTFAIAVGCAVLGCFTTKMDCNVEDCIDRNSELDKYKKQYEERKKQYEELKKQFEELKEQFDILDQDYSYMESQESKYLDAEMAAGKLLVEFLRRGRDRFRLHGYLLSSRMIYDEFYDFVKEKNIPGILLDPENRKVFMTDPTGERGKEISW